MSYFRAETGMGDGSDASPNRTHYLRPQYVAPNLAGYGTLAGDVQMSLLKISKTLAKLDRGEALTQAERDAVSSAQPYPIAPPKAPIQNQAADNVSNILSVIAKACPFPPLWPLLDLAAQLVLVVAYGGDLGKVSKANMRIAASQAPLTATALSWVPGVPPSLPKLVDGLGRVCGALGNDQPLTGALLADVAGSATALSGQAGPSEVSGMIQQLQGVADALAKVPGVGSLFSAQNKASVQQAEQQLRDEAAKAKFNDALARAKAKLGQSVKVGPSPGGTIKTAGATSPATTSGPGSPVLAVLAFGGAALLVASAFKKKRSR